MPSFTMPSSIVSMSNRCSLFMPCSYPITSMSYSLDITFFLPKYTGKEMSVLVSQDWFSIQSFFSAVCCLS